MALVLPGYGIHAGHMLAKYWPCIKAEWKLGEVSDRHAYATQGLRGVKKPWAILYRLRIFTTEATAIPLHSTHTYPSKKTFTLLRCKAISFIHDRLNKTKISWILF